ncbi:Tat pathway signal sequence domain protein, partial [Streptomyces sp. T21Q-yed]|nr:Tat pathway signal sequence domain protein [Streptomyces sp. T21Q-yed]
MRRTVLSAMALTCTALLAGITPAFADSTSPTSVPSPTATAPAVTAVPTPSAAEPT